MTAPDDEAPLEPAQERLVRQVRRIAIGSSLVMLLGFLVVVGVIGYRLFAGAERGTPPEATVVLPKGARVLSTAIADGKLAVTIELSGMVEVLLYDIATLGPRGRLRLAPAP